MHAVRAGIRGQLSVLTHKGRIQIQIDNLLLLRHLLGQFIINPQVLIGQILRPAPGGNGVLVEGNQVLDIDDRVGLAGPNVIDDLTVGVIKA